METKPIATQVSLHIMDHEVWYSPELIREKYPQEEEIGGLRLNWVFTEHSFHFVVSKFLMSDVYGQNEVRDIIIHGVGYWDGVRHVYFGDSNCGYIYYPSVTELTEVLTRLGELEKGVGK